jgi:Short C-terminal domain
VSTPEPAADIPPMPVLLEQRGNGSLLPVWFGMSVRLDSSGPAGSGLLTLSDSKGGRVSKFPGTPAGWIEAWQTVAQWARPGPYRRGLDAYRQNCRLTRQPLRSATAAARLEESAPLVLSGLAFLGGRGGGEQLTEGTVVDLRRGPASVSVYAAADAALLVELAAAVLTGAEASGPGPVTTGGFVTATGSGLFGDLRDRAAAQWMTDHFGRTKMNTTVRLTGTSCELFFRSLGDPPEAAQVALSAVRALIADSAPARPPGLAGANLLTAVPSSDPPVSAAENLVAQLERLARLHQSGALTDQEFQTAKTRLLLG